MQEQSRVCDQVDFADCFCQQVLPDLHTVLPMYSVADDTSAALDDSVSEEDGSFDELSDGTPYLQSGVELPMLNEVSQLGGIDTMIPAFAFLTTAEPWKTWVGSAGT